MIGYTDVQDARCLECLVNRPRLDSNYRECMAAIQDKQHQNDLLIEKLTLCGDAILALKSENDKLARNKKWLQVGIGTVMGIAIFEAILLILK